MRPGPLPLVLLPFLLAACDPDESLTAYGAADTVWQLETLDGAPLGAAATVEFPEPGQIAGQAPCNRFFGEQRAPYPWFEVGPLAATRMACPDLDKEQNFLSALAAMTEVEVAGDILILRGDDGREMLFRAAP
ncbi:META domain-containing protein [Marivivens marinus]|uniref:META domain-containing protein n=1 Tax=Marivivens marinus TaxID=3110173 RepID=UPI003B846E25